jgi:hypothetical protein
LSKNREFFWKKGRIEIGFEKEIIMELLNNLGNQRRLIAFGKSLIFSPQQELFRIRGEGDSARSGIVSRLTPQKYLQSKIVKRQLD